MDLREKGKRWSGGGGGITRTIGVTHRVKEKAKEAYLGTALT